MRKNDGGPAFPKAAAVSGNGQVADCSNDGMTLRDYYIGQFLRGDAAAGEGWGPEVSDECIAIRVALYERMADAILARRNNQEAP